MAGCLGLPGPCLRTPEAVHDSSAVLSLAPALVGTSAVSLLPVHFDTSAPCQVHIPHPHPRSQTLRHQKLPSEVSEYSGNAPSHWNKVSRFCCHPLYIM